MELIEEKQLAINKINNIEDLGIMKSINDLLDSLPIENDVFEEHKSLIFKRFNDVKNKKNVLIDWETVEDEL